MININRISKTYYPQKGRPQVALSEVSLTLPDHGLIFILGKSGSGKSTLLNILGGLDRANSGEITIDGKDFSDFKQRDFDSYRNTMVGFVFQEFYLLPEFNVRRNIEFALELQGKSDGDQLQPLAEQLGVAEYLDRKPQELSGGQKQRVSIARALIKNPKIVLADEPTGNLDQQTGAQIFETLKKISGERLVIVVSHDRESAEKYGDGIVEMADGRIVSSPSQEVTLSNPVSDQTYLRSKLPMKRAVAIGLSAMNSHKIRLLFSLLLSLVCLCLFCLFDVINSYDRTTATFETFRHNNVKNYGIYQVSQDLKPKFLEESTVETLQNSQNRLFEKRNAVIDLPINGENSYFSKTLNGVIEMSDLSDLGLEMGHGAYPTESDEIAVTEYIADAMLMYGIRYFDQIANNYVELHFERMEDILGCRFLVDNQYLNRYYTITGIVKNPYDLTAYEDLKAGGMEIPSEFADLKTQGLLCVLFAGEGFWKDSENFPLIASDDTTQLTQFYYEEKPVITGQTNRAVATASLSPSSVLFAEKDAADFSDDDIAINTDLFFEIVLSTEMGKGFFGREGLIKHYIEKYQIAESPDQIRIAQQKICGEFFASESISKKLVMKYPTQKETKTYRIRGIIQSTSQSGSVAVNARELLRLSQWDRISVLFARFDGGRSDRDFLKTISMFSDSEDMPLFTSGEYASALNGNLNGSNFYARIFGWASLVLLVFSVLLLANFIFATVSAKNRENGVLRAMGARTLDLLKIYLFEALVLAAILFVLTILSAYFITVYALNLLVNAVPGAVTYTMGWRQILIIGGISLVVTGAASALPVIKVSRMKPIDAIKTSE